MQLKFPVKSSRAIGIAVVGMEAFRRRTAVTQDRVTAAATAALSHAVDPLLHNMQRVCPVDSQALRNSLGKKVVPLTHSIVFGVVGPQRGDFHNHRNVRAQRYAHIVEKRTHFMGRSWSAAQPGFNARFSRRFFSLLRVP